MRYIFLEFEKIFRTSYRGWSRALIWASVELYQVEGHHGLCRWKKLFKIDENLEQLVQPFYQSIDASVKGLE